MRTQGQGAQASRPQGRRDGAPRPAGPRAPVQPALRQMAAPLSTGRCCRGSGPALGATVLRAEMTCVLLNSCVSPRGHLSLDLGPARPQDHRPPRDPEDLSPTCRDACPVSGHTGSRAQGVGVPSRSPLGSLHHPDDVTSGREEPGVTADPGRGPGPPLSPADHGRRQSVSPLLHGPLHRHLLPPQAGHCARPRAGTRPAPALLGTGLPRPPLCLACPTPRPSEPASFLSKVHSGSPSRPADSATGHGGGQGAVPVTTVSWRPRGHRPR